MRPSCHSSRLPLQYFHGNGGPVDYTKARCLLAAAAEQGPHPLSVDAMGLLGNMHLFGYGGPVDVAEACRWYSGAAELGDPDAMAILETLK